MVIGALYYSVWWHFNYRETRRAHDPFSCVQPPSDLLTDGLRLTDRLTD